VENVFDVAHLGPGYVHVETWGVDKRAVQGVKADIWDNEKKRAGEATSDAAPLGTIKGSRRRFPF